MEEKEKTNKRSKRKKKKDKNTKSQENYFKTIRAIVEGKTVTIIMFLNTLFALVGDDIRLWLFTKDFDLYFNILFAISLLLFVLELLFNSLIRSIYAEPIFFYLDIIATLSLVPDVEWLMLLLTI